MPSSQPNPDTPPADKALGSTIKKIPASLHKKAKGRNQLAKDRETTENDTSPARSMSRDIAKVVDEKNASSNSNSKAVSADGLGKQGKTKGAAGSKITMSDMKRRATAILEFISRTQVELANDPIFENGRSRPNSDDAAVGKSLLENLDGAKNHMALGPSTKAAADIPAGSAAASKDFKQLTCVEMMDVLSRDLVKWEKEFI